MGCCTGTRAHTFRAHLALNQQTAQRQLQLLRVDSGGWRNNEKKVELGEYGPGWVVTDLPK